MDDEKEMLELEMLLNLEKRADKLEMQIQLKEIELRVIRKMIDDLSKEETDDPIHDCDFNNTVFN